MANSYSLDLELSSSQYASIADASQTGLDLSTTGTLECWVKFESLSTDGSNRGLISKDDDVGRSYNFFVGEASGVYTLHGLVLNGANYDYYKATITPSTGIWYHYALTIDVGNPSATTFEFFENGISLGNGTAINSSNISTIADTGASFYIGNEAYSTDNYHDGLIDEVRVWNDVRTAQEISDNFTKELVGNEANLVGYWKLNNDYLDETSNNNDLTATNSPVFSTTVVFDDDNDNLNSVDFERSSSQYASIADGSQTGLDLSTDFSIECWVKLEQLPSSAGGQMSLVTKYDSSYSYGFFINASDYMYMFTSGNGSTTFTQVRNTTTFTSADVGVWRHLVITSDISAGAAGVKFYKNGILQSNHTDIDTSTTIYNSTAPFVIGADGNPGAYLDGLIDEVRVWSDIRTQTEIIDNMARQLAGTEANLVGYWKLDNDYLDETTNNNDLTATNSPVFDTDVPFDFYTAPGGVRRYFAPGIWRAV